MSIKVDLLTKGLGCLDAALRRVLPGPCGFCLAPPLPGAPWCAACFVALPWNRSACVHCAEPLPEAATALCGRCLKQPPAFARSRVGLRYEGEIAALMQRFKFMGEPRAGTLLVSLMQASLAVLDEERRPQALLALPRHPRRARERGFDPAIWLTQQLSDRLGIPLVAAQRLRHTPTQRGLDRQARRRNLRGAFSVTAALPARVAVVDDIMTTGASLDALARACLVAGAEEVEAWAVARTPLSRV